MCCKRPRNAVLIPGMLFPPRESQFVDTLGPRVEDGAVGLPGGVFDATVGVGAAQSMRRGMPRRWA